MGRHRDPADQGGDFGDRLCFALLGAFFGLPMGLVLLFLGFSWLPGVQPPVSIVWVTVGYCAVFGFLFGEDLADFVGMFGRFLAVVLMIETGQVVSEPSGSWFRPTLVALSFVLLLLILGKLFLGRAG